MENITSSNDCPGLYQLGFFVPSIEAAEPKISRLLNVPNFFLFPDVRFCDAEYRGRRVNLRVNVAIGYSNGMQIELVEPLSGCEGEYADFISRTGGGLHHVARLTDDFEKDFRGMLQQGHDVLQSGYVGEERSIQFAYFDTSAQLGVVTELIAVSPAMARIYERLKRRSQAPQQAPDTRPVPR